MLREDQIFKHGLGKIHREHEWKGCAKSGEDCSSEIAVAHSIQNNRILNRIARNGKVYVISLEGRRERLEINLQEKGRGSASTFRGFCRHHDQVLFTSIDQRDFNSADQEQEFLFAYRVIAKEYHAKQTNLNTLKFLLRIFESKNYDELKQAWPFYKEPDEPQFYENHLVGAIAGTEDSLKHIEKLRIAFNANLESKNFWKNQTIRLKLGKNYPIGAAACITLHNDLDGNVINNIYDVTRPLSFMFVTLFPQDHETHVLMSYRYTDQALYEPLKRQLAKASPKRLKIVISNILCMYVDNLAISPVYWDNLPGRIRTEFMHFYNETLSTRPDNLVARPRLNIFV